MSSASKKRHSTIFEVKTRQLVEEESKVFRKLHAKQLDFNENDESETMQQSTNNGSSVGHQMEDNQWKSPSTIDHLPANRDGSGAHAMKKALKRTRIKSTSKKRVQFTEESIILNVALEGELDLLKECTRKVRTIVCQQLRWT